MKKTLKIINLFILILLIKNIFDYFKKIKIILFLKKVCIIFIKLYFVKLIYKFISFSDENNAIFINIYFFTLLIFNYSLLNDLKNYIKLLIFNIIKHFSIILILKIIFKFSLRLRKNIFLNFVVFDFFYFKFIFYLFVLVAVIFYNSIKNF